MKGFTVVIAGAGYGGLAAARTLARRAPDLHVILIDQHDYHLLQFQLHEAAVNKIDPETLALPMHALLPRGVEFIQAHITGFGFSARIVHTDRGDFGYDRLIIALGGQPATYNIKGLSEHALMLKSLSDARRIRGHLLMTLSALKARGANHPYSIVVGGAGITGVELAAELSEGLAEMTHECDLDPGDVQVMLLEAAPSILPGFDAKTVEEATRVLKQMGVDVRTQAMIEQVEAERVVVRSNDTSQVIETGTLIWTGGVRANWLVSSVGLTLGERGAALVDEHLRSVDHSDVAIIGDSAVVRDSRDGQVVMPCGQLAKHQGAFIAHDILAELEGKPRRPYVPHMDGLLISLGGRRGVGHVGPVWVRRLLARTLKIGAELRYLLNTGGIALAALRGLRLRYEWVKIQRGKLRPKSRISNLKSRTSKRAADEQML